MIGPAAPTPSALAALRPLPLTAVRLDPDGLLGGWQERNASATLPHCIDQLTAYGNLAFDPEVIAVYRLVIGECGRFPELGQTFFEAAIRPTSRAIADWLARQCRRGSIKLNDPEQAADMLRGMMVMEPQRAALLGQASPPDGSAIAGRAKACARVFLEGCRA